MGCKPLRGTQLSTSSCLTLGLKSGSGRERRSLFLPAGSFPSGHWTLVHTPQLSSTLPNSCGTLGLRCSFQPEGEDAPASVQAPCSWTGLPPEGENLGENHFPQVLSGPRNTAGPGVGEHRRTQDKDLARVTRSPPASRPLCCPTRRQGGGAPARTPAFPRGPPGTCWEERTRFTDQYWFHFLNYPILGHQVVTF